jgi:transposase
MTRYIGLDVHAQTTVVAVLTDSGKRAEHRVLQTRPTDIIAMLKELPKPRRLILEEGNQSEWLSQVLEPFVDDLVVTVPRPTSNRSKSDIADAFALAESLRRNTFDKRIFKAGERAGGLRAAFKLYDSLTRDCVRIKNRFRGLVQSRGLMSGIEYDPSLQELEAMMRQLPSALRFGAEALLEQLSYLDDLRSRASDVLMSEAQKRPDFRLLLTIPGIGEVRAATLLSVVIDPHRFRTSEQFRSYCGLAITTEASAEWSVDRAGRRQRVREPWTRGLTRGNAQLKNVFCGAALTVIASAGPLAEHHSALLKRGLRPQLARLTLARKLAGITLALWKRKEAYDSAKHTTLK